MADPKPITLTQIDEGDYTSEHAPQPFIVVGDMPGAGGGGGGGPVESVNGQTGAVVLDAADVGAATEGYVDTAIDEIPAPGVSDVTGLSTALSSKADRGDIIVLGVLDYDEEPPAPGVYLRRPAP